MVTFQFIWYMGRLFQEYEPTLPWMKQSVLAYGCISGMSHVCIVDYFQMYADPHEREAREDLHGIT